MKRLAICIPTYNEKENIKSLIEELKSTMQNADIKTTVMIIDDNSPDGTGQIVDNLAKKYNSTEFRLDPIHRSGKLGLASAYIEAFQKAIKDDYDYILSMDADFSHQPKYILDMLKEIKNNDLVIGSRNVKGGGVENWSMFRNFISKGGSLYSRIILGVNIKDFTGGFNLYKKQTLQEINIATIRSEGYSFQIEMKYRIAKKGLKIKEVPIIFPDREFGKAKMSKKIFLEAFFRVWQLRFSKP